MVPELQNHRVQLLPTQVCGRVPLKRVLGEPGTIISANNLGQCWTMPREIEHELEFVEVLARIPDGLYEREARDSQARLAAPPESRYLLA